MKKQKISQVHHASLRLNTEKIRRQINSLLFYRDEKDLDNALEDIETELSDLFEARVRILSDLKVAIQDVIKIRENKAEKSLTNGQIFEALTESLGRQPSRDEFTEHMRTLSK